MESPLGWRRGGNLPLEPTSFVGREEQLLRLSEMLMTSRLVSVIGMGGVGKSRLAMRAAHQQRESFPDGVWKVDLAAVQEESVLPHVLMSSLGLRDGSRSDLDALHGYLRNKRMLIILDTCEHLTTACAQLIDELKVHDQLQFLATSRQPLGLDFEQRLTLAPLEEKEAVLLFRDRAAEIMPYTEPDRAAVAEIVRHLDGIPLAIELAVGRLPALSVEKIRGLLGDRFRLLRRDRQSTGSDRHHTLLATLGWSYELCEPLEQLLWARLSLFAGSFDLAAAKFVCTSDELPEALLVKTLHGLVNKSIVVHDSRAERYRMLDTIRVYGAERLQEQNETGWLVARYCAYYHDMVRRAEQGWAHGSRQVYWHGLLMLELTHLRAVFEYYLADRAGSERALAMSGSLWFLWHGCGMSSEGAHYLDRALANSRRPTRERCKALWVLAFVISTTGDADRIEALALRCVEESAIIGDADAMVYGTAMTGIGAYLRGDVSKALAYLGSAVKSFRAEIGLNPGLLPTIVELSSCLILTGQPEEAEELLLECMEMCEEAGEQWVRSYVLWGLADANRVLGRHGKAIEAAKNALRIKRDFHDVVGIMLCTEQLAWAYAGQAGHESLKQAALLMGATGACWEHFGLLPLFGSVIFLAEHEKAEAAAQLLLSPEVYEEIAGKGATFDVEAMLEAALEG